MIVVLVALVGVLTLLVAGVAVLAWRLSRRLARLEVQLIASSASDARAQIDDTRRSETRGAEAAPEYVITHLGEPEFLVADDGVAEAIAGAPTVPAGQFADIVLRESVIKGASLFHGVRRALSPENRNRIRFEVKREVKRSRKQRRTEIREARREWEARQRAALVEEHAA